MNRGDSIWLEKGDGACHAGEWKLVKNSQGELGFLHLGDNGYFHFEYCSELDGELDHQNRDYTDYVWLSRPKPVDYLCMFEQLLAEGEINWREF